MVYVGKGEEDPPRVVEFTGDTSADPNRWLQVPSNAEAAVLLCDADFLDVACSCFVKLKRSYCPCPVIAVVLRPAHGVFLAKISSVAMTLKKGGADNVIIQPRQKMDLPEKLQAVLGFVSARWEFEKNLREQPDAHANSLFFEVVDQVIEGFPRLNASMVEKKPTRNSLGGVGRHAFTSALGEGKFGKVYTTAASDRPDAPCEAVKVLSKRNIRTARHCNQVLKECRLLQKVRHPNIAEFRGLVHATWHVYIFMEFVGKMDLAMVIRAGDNGRLESATVLELFLQICDAIAYCHEMLVAHRDIKSENVVVTQDFVPKLVDFGLAVQLSKPSSEPELCSDKCGTIPFAPPEVYRGKKFEASAMDVWGLGILTLEMRCGNNSVCHMLGCGHIAEPNDELANKVERFFSCPDWPQVAQKANAGVGLADELLCVMRNSLVVAPELRWPAVDLWRHIASSRNTDRQTRETDRQTRDKEGDVRYADEQYQVYDDSEMLSLTLDNLRRTPMPNSAASATASASSGSLPVRRLSKRPVG
jgi:serine/threonine protein kinase